MRRYGKNPKIKVPAAPPAPPPPPLDMFPVLFSFLAGLLVFLLLVLSQGPVIDENAESRIFMLAVLLCPAAAGLILLALSKFPRWARACAPASILSAGVLTAVLWLQFLRPSTDLRLSVALFGASMAAGTTYGFWRGVKMEAEALALRDAAMPFIFFCALAAALPFSCVNTRLAEKAWGLGILAVVAALPLFFPEFSPGKTLRRALDIVLPAAIVLLIFSPAYPIEPFHQSCYLGPASDLLLGKSLLADIHCQYGVGVIYFLAGIFKLGLAPLSFQGLSAVVAVLYGLEYALLYFLLRGTTRSLLFSAMGVAVIALTNFFAQSHEQLLHVVSFPSTGPLRFGPVYLILAAELARQAPRPWRRLGTARYVILAAASVWSLEMFVCAFAVHVFLGAARCFSEPEDRVRRAMRGVATTAASIGIAYAAVAFDIYRRTGEGPHWDRYLELVRVYTAGGMGTLPVDPWSAWAVIAAVYLASFLAVAWLLFTGRRPLTQPRMRVALAMTAFGILQMPYFVGRSHANNLHHICVPAVFLGFYWLAVLTASPAVRGKARLLLRYAGWCAILFLAFECAWPSFVKKWPYTLPGAVATGTKNIPLWAKTVSEPDMNQAAQLVNKYAEDKKEIALFVDPSMVTELQALLRKTNAFPLSYVVDADDRAPGHLRRAVEHPHRLQPGDYLFTGPGREKTTVIQARIVKRLCGEFDCVVEETTPAGFVATRLDKKK